MTEHVERSAKTGEFVTEEYAEKHPSTTERETVEREDEKEESEE